MSWNGYENNVLLRNDGCGEDGIPRFTDVAMSLGADDQGDGRGVAIADFDNDGDLDVAVNRNPGDNADATRRRAVLLRNDVGHRRPWLAVELAGTRSTTEAVGAEVRLEHAGHIQVKTVKVGNGFASQSSRRLYFGLGDDEAAATEPVILAVRWPEGEEETFPAVPARSLVRITQGEPGGTSRLEITNLPRAVSLGAPPAEGTASPTRSR